MTRRTWFITGSNSGFGRALTENILARGGRVAATSRKPELLGDLKDRYPEQIRIAALDVTDKQAVLRAMDEAFSFFGTIDVVVNNAGYLALGAAEEMTDKEIARQIDTNLIGSIDVVRAALPHLRRQKGGRIIQHSSMIGQFGLPALAAYQASKWGIEGFLEAVMLEVAVFNIQVCIVEPGLTRTGLAGNAKVEAEVIDAYQQTTVGNFRRLLASGRFPSPGDPQKIARAIIAAAEQETMPRRLVLGSDAYHHVHKALSARLRHLEEQKEIAFATDAEK